MYRRQGNAKHGADSEETMAPDKADSTATERAFTGSEANGGDVLSY